ncbi:hypothetical protein A7317_03750 [Pseudomonas fluorescens]|uniref:Uncharacterized protein n=1 Tax=Pseudomonas gorinensis TaxID=3240790 RepID=A0ACA7P0B5_9PSED|nr:hypothetical protein U771_04145 [Pseudomonas sp. TKP]AOE66132.1 hypothetical protein A7317_03750 [Pseudomonas fluorescens]AOE71907.1 hypothetical protein A7319_03510 [Pseudomonas fluorescens]
MVEKRFKGFQQVLLTAIPRQALQQPEVAGCGSQGQGALEMRETGLTETMPRLQRVMFEA